MIDLPPLLDWIPRCDSRFSSPHHLAQFVELLERAPRSGMRAMVSVPIRHHKTWTVICAISWWLRKDPTLRIVYMTYSIKRAEEIGKDIRDLCRRSGIEPAKGYDTIQNWRNDVGGGVACMSADQSKLGADVDVLIWDDPFSGPIEADKPEVRTTVDETIAFYTNRLSRGGSCIGVMSRFHPDDAIGRRIPRAGWTYVHNRAIENEGTLDERAFAPDVFSLEEIKAKRLEMRDIDPSERTFYSQWQNEPRAPTSDLFRDPARYETLPDWPGFRDVIGLDMSYTTARISDWSAIVIMRVYGNSVYVRDVQRIKLDVGTIRLQLRAALQQYGRAPIYSYVSGPERGIVADLNQNGVPVEPLPARYNKLVRAQRTVDRWNAGRIMVPTAAPWLDGFLGRVGAFRGVEGDDDDEVDALVSGHDGALGVASSGHAPLALGSRRM